MSEISELEFWQRYDCDRSQTLDGRGQCSVYAARDKESGQLWGIKLLELHQNFDQENHLYQAYERAQSLSHSYLLPYEELRCWVEGVWRRYAIRMPLVELGSVDKENPAEDWNETQRWEFWENCARAVGFLHSQGLVHQQLSPAHILIKKSAGFICPMLIQYGWAQPLPLAFIKNWECLAPEQFGEQPVFDIRTDIWALGILGYWLWTGRYPFGQKSSLSTNKTLQNNILQDEIPALIRQLPPTMQAVVGKCLEKEPAQRWSSVAEMLEFVQKSKQSQPDLNPNTERAQEPETAQEKPARRVIRRRPSKPIRWWLVLLLLLLAVLLGRWLNGF